MSVDKPKSKMIVIHTEQYAGNFEREMCAYITGQIGQCGIGKQYSLQNMTPYFQWWSNNIVQEADDNGCYRPVTIYPTPNWFNNGNGGHYKENSPESKNAQKDNYQFLLSYHKPQLDMIQRRLDNQDFDNVTPYGWTKKACEENLKRINNEIKEAKTSYNKYPAYMSVAIFVEKMPPKEIMDEFIQRAHDFAKYYDSKNRFKGLSNKEQNQIDITNIETIEPNYKLKKKKIM